MRSLRIVRIRDDPLSDCALGSTSATRVACRVRIERVVPARARRGGVRVRQPHLCTRVARGARSGQCTGASSAFPARTSALSPALADIARAVERIYPAGDIWPRASGSPPTCCSTRARRRATRGSPSSGRSSAHCRLRINSKPNRHGRNAGVRRERGTLKAKVVLAPTVPATLQTLQFAPRSSYRHLAGVGGSKRRRLPTVAT